MVKVSDTDSSVFRMLESSVFRISMACTVHELGNLIDYVVFTCLLLVVAIMSLSRSIY